MTQVKKKQIKELLQAAVWSDAEEKVSNKVADILNKHPELLFHKSQVTKEGIKTSKMYRFDFMHENRELEHNVIYINGSNKKISYSLITPMGKKIQGILTDIDTPTPFALSNDIRKKILNDTTKEGYTPTLYEQTYYDVSLFQLILFSGDIYLLEKIKPFINEANREEAQKQRDELSGGGSDLVKLGSIQAGNCIKDISEISYQELTQFTEKNAEGEPKQEQVENGLFRNITWSLQENKDALVLYDHNYYYVCLNHETETVEKRESIAFINDNQYERYKLDSLFIDMEMNSGRRSNDQEHQIILATTKSASNETGIQLERKGIRYRQGNNYYQNCKAESLIARALRKYLRLWDEADALTNHQNVTEEVDRDSWEKVEEAWLDVGKAHATDTADKLLLYCIKDMPLYPVPEFKIKLADTTQNMKREFKFDSFITKYQPNIGIYSARDISIGLNFSLVKGCGRRGGLLGAVGVAGWRARVGGVVVRFDFTALCRYDEMSRANVDEFTKSLDLPNITAK